MIDYEVIVIGGGAAGICAAISAARAGRSVLICERNDRLGRKLLATGDGRCNLLNEKIHEKYFNASARFLVKSVFSKFNKQYILQFFQDLGLEVYTREDGRIFPVTNQASSVLKVLEIELKRLKVPCEYDFYCTRISFSDNEIHIFSEAGKTFSCQKLIITGGGQTFPSFGSDGNAFRLANSIGHTIVEPVPCAVPLTVKDPLCNLLQGQKISATVKAITGDKIKEKYTGELLFTKYGLSGTAILDVSEKISLAINREHKDRVFLQVDLVPFMSELELKVTLIKRKQRGFQPDEMLVGILPNKICAALQDLFDDNQNIDNVVKTLKSKLFKVSGTRGWNEAEFTAGGIRIEEINPCTLESRLKKNIYFAGEIIDVNGKRGGYNLAWAWASGLLAGTTGSL